MNYIKAFISATILFTTVFTIFSCKKYEEGPSLSLRSKDARIANQWKISFSKDLGDGSITTHDHIGDVWEFTKEGAFIKNGVQKGTWELSSSKEQIIITKLDGSLDNFIILKLKENEMWLQEPGDEELHLTSL